MNTRIGAVASVAAAILGLGACGSSSSSTTSGSSAAKSGSSAKGTLNGSGSTLAAPIYQQWGQNLSSQGLTLNYNPLGSGAGVAALQAGTVDFAGSDPAMKSSEIQKAKGPVLQFPVAFGAITVAYNLQGVKAGLKLNGQVIADIYLGKVKTWNNPEIANLNPGVKLPSQTITVVHRSDSSGTTKGFTQFLAAYNPSWASAAGKPDKTAKWPTGTGAPKNAGVASAVKQTPGAIGYVEQAYALQNGFTTAAVKNKSGQYVAPTLAATTAAASSAKVPSNLAVSTINAPGATAYPIVSQTFVIIYKDMCKAGRSSSQASLAKKFLTYGLGAGQQVEQQLEYASAPAALLSKMKTQLNTMVCNGQPVS
ncbi:MAG: phosphate ABC transporter substrate-binding protein PstS [Solirubrobacterales bacterium]|nr:phosphate ABC transporter substrate-binding protein PstS [Solirubrobacterales bacterium]